MTDSMRTLSLGLLLIGGWQLANAQQVDRGQCGISILCAEVNKQRQEIYIHIPGEGIYTDKVSTGGGWKNPENGAAPYCADAETPNVEKWIPATPDNMGEMRYSGEFSTETKKVPMPYYIWVQNGIFLHQVPSDKYIPYLGQNVSAGCIRLSKTTAPKLFKLMQDHGGLYLSIYGKNPDGDNFCRDTSKPAESVATDVRQSQDDGFLFGPSGDSNLPGVYDNYDTGVGQSGQNSDFIDGEYRDLQPPKRRTGIGSVFQSLGNGLKKIGEDFKQNGKRVGDMRNKPKREQFDR